MATIHSTTPTDVPEAQFKTVCEIQNVHPSLVNAIRRTLLSEVPNVGFDIDSHDDIEKNSIKIRSNTSALHNEFIAHRIALVPICVKDSGRLNIRSTWNDALGIRENRFAQDGTLTFTCDLKNDEATREARHLEHREKDVDPVNDMLLVTTLDFRCSEGEAKEYLRPDPMIRNMDEADAYTTYILLNKLKKGSEGNEGTLHIECSPRIGTGCTHSLYSPVGTAAYKFVEESEEVQTGIFEQWLKKANLERAEKGLHAFSATEQDEQRVSFNMLDAKRVYHRDANGDANRIQLTVESVGGHHPMKIIQHALQSIYHRLRDIVVCFRAKEGFQYELNSKDKSWVKVECVPSFSKMDATDFVLHGESHTLANPITKYMQTMFQGEDATVGNYLDFVSYTKPHPLNEKVHFRIKLRGDLDVRALFEKIKTHSDSVDPLLREALSGDTDEIADDQLHAFLLQFLFLQGVNRVIHVLQTLINQWTSTIASVDTGGNEQFLLWSDYSEDTARALYDDTNMVRLLV